MALFLNKLASLVPGLHSVDVDVPLKILRKDKHKLEQVGLGREFHTSLGTTVPIRVHLVDSLLTVLWQKLQIQRRYGYSITCMNFTYFIEHNADLP
ncbi:U6 snRNA phosphodiesterase-like [Prunus yedoensis var. nudiflora]|uniref:U6 snRNA phosphodiesterase 1 n=1 Tax=Prunus yedoensis var. nudiflora TaxID=2094558 RepID=A0A314Z8A7_PRUYE|nr:U6 snRNA phosphodiesterase-like [Prunus yedoensis var. nudiflora]